MNNKTLNKFKELLKKRSGINDLMNITNPLQKMYIDFALSTIGRGEYVKNIVSEHINISGKRYIDVGCAYGGFLVAFAGARAVDITGIDINGSLLDYSRAILEDCDITANVSEKDILNKDHVINLGRFDIITCNDVIEHVDNPETAMQNMVSMLNEDGLIFMQIPNRFSVQFINFDGHFQLFGITILPKFLADKYYNSIFPLRKHDVTYKSLNYYVNKMKNMNMICQVTNPIEKNKKERLESILKVFKECEQKAGIWDSGLPNKIKTSIENRVFKISKFFKQQYNKYLILENTDSILADKLADKLIITFGTDFWSIIARK